LRKDALLAYSELLIAKKGPILRLKFDKFRLDVEQRRLFAGDKEVLLAPKALEVLIYFAQRPNQVLRREALIEELWPGLYVDDHALSFQIGEIRRALEDDPRQPRFLETRPRLGYRFLASVEREEDKRPQAAEEFSLPETHYARSGDVDIAYQTLGNGALDVVFVMGWVSHVEHCWQEPRFAAFLRRLAGFGRLILFDKRGTGLSDRVDLHELPTLEQRMDDLRAVMDATGSSRAVLVGVSEGGPLSALFAATYPEKTAALIMFGSYARRLRSDTYPWGPTREQRDAYCREIREKWGGPVGIEDRAPSLKDDEAFRQWWASYLRLGASPGAAEALTRMNAEIDVRPVLPAIRTPALVLHRHGDQCLLVEEGRYLANLIPEAKFCALDGADHLPFVGDQKPMFEAVETFLRQLAPAEEATQSLVTLVVFHMAQPVSAVLRGELERVAGWMRGRMMGETEPLLIFDGPARAVRCAQAFVDAAIAIDAAVAAAVHTGECEFRGNLMSDGQTLQTARQMLATAQPEEVVVSRVVRDLVSGSGLLFAEHGDVRASHGDERWPTFLALR
jgi:pimeloyl-ACP methyl ester carboxylesterase